MKTTIQDYKDFINDIKNEELVYLFGTGISASLTGASYSWLKWLYDGTKYINDSIIKNEIQLSLKNNPSTENLLFNASRIIQITKDNGSYNQWMMNSFENKTIINTKLADTIKRMLIAQDVIATTNFDSLLEESTGLSSLTYEEPDKVFCMLNNHKSSSIIHIHGKYDSKSGVDNIIADNNQYSNLLNNKGAQFIQNLLGTKTVIFIGCGQTSEDPNISELIKFANENLHINKEYYFLHKEGDCPKNLPKFVNPICYGNEYLDLQSFLGDLAQIRIGTKLQNSPLIIRTAYTKSNTDSYGLSDYHYSREKLKFVGRKVEISSLLNFLETDRDFSWWAITGQGGSGKSRLALELLKRSKTQYFGFFANPNSSEADINEFIPFNDTLIVIDYVKGNEQKIAKFCSSFIDKFSKLTYKLRILLLERENVTEFGSWYNSLFSYLDNYHKTAFDNGEYNIEITTRKHNFLSIEDLDENSVLEYIGEICKAHKLPLDKHRDERLKKEYADKFEVLRYRPLFLQLYVETWINSGCIGVKYDNYRQLLESIVQREQDKILDLISHDINTFNSLIKIIIYAGIFNEIPLNTVIKNNQNDWNIVKEFVNKNSIIGKQQNDFLSIILSSASQSILNDETKISVMYPDIIKEFMFLYYLDEFRMKEICNNMWKEYPQELNNFLSKCLTDFQDDEVLTNIIRNESKNYDNLNAMEARLAIMCFKIIDNNDTYLKLQNNDLEEYNYWTNAIINNNNKKLCFLGFYRSINQAMSWTWEDKCFNAINQLVDFETDSELTITKVRYLLEFIHYLNERNSYKHVQDLITKAKKIIYKIKDKQIKAELFISLKREMLVYEIAHKNWDSVEKLLYNLERNLDVSNEKHSELYAYALLSGALKCYQDKEYSKLLYFSDALQDYLVEAADSSNKIYINDKVHAYYLYSKFLSIDCFTVGKQHYLAKSFGINKVDEFITEIKRNEMIADFSGILIGSYKTKIRLDNEQNESTINKYLNECDELLERYPESPLLAEQVIWLWHTVYVHHFKQKISSNLLDKAITILLRFPKDKSVLIAFFNLWADAKDLNKYEKVIKNKIVRCGILENGLREFLLPTIQYPHFYDELIDILKEKYMIERGEF